MRICYLIQSHAFPDQISRLVRTLSQLDPDCFIYLSHDKQGVALPVELERTPSIKISFDVGGRGRFHNVQRWLDAATWLRAHEPVDYLVTITAQDYPLRSMAELHRALASAGDGLMEHFPVLRPGGNWPLHEGRLRYLYAWHDLHTLSAAQKSRLRPLLVLNRMQPAVRFNVAYDYLRVGVRASGVFNKDFECWGGSVFTNVSWRAVEYVLDVAASRPDLMAWARRSLLIEEAFLQSVLISAGTFRFDNSSGRYYDFKGARHGSPATLGEGDLPQALASGAFFGRKWSSAKTPGVFQHLDAALGLE